MSRIAQVIVPPTGMGVNGIVAFILIALILITVAGTIYFSRLRLKIVILVM